MSPETRPANHRRGGNCPLNQTHPDGIPHEKERTALEPVLLSSCRLCPGVSARALAGGSDCAKKLLVTPLHRRIHRKSIGAGLNLHPLAVLSLRSATLCAAPVLYNR
jgi:hypothetical protein